MRLYQRKLFKLRLIKNMYSMLYDMAFIYFLMPKIIWESLLWTFHSLEWCNGDWGGGMQLIVAAAFAVIYKVLDIIVHIPFGAYQTFWIEKPEGLSEATPCAFICQRLGILAEFILLNIPILLVLCAAATYSGKWLWLVCLLTTGIFKCLIIWLYPVIIMPIFSDFRLLENEKDH